MSRGKNNQTPRLGKPRIANGLPLAESYVPTMPWQQSWFSHDHKLLPLINYEPTEQLIAAYINFDFIVDINHRIELHQYFKSIRNDLLIKHPNEANYRMFDMLADAGGDYFNQKLGINGDNAFWNYKFTPIKTENDKRAGLEILLNTLLEYQPNSEASKNTRQFIYNALRQKMQDELPHSTSDQARGLDSDPVAKLNAYDYADLLDFYQFLSRQKSFDTEPFSDTYQEMVELLCDPDPELKSSGVFGMMLTYQGEINLKEPEWNKTALMLSQFFADKELHHRLKQVDNELLHRITNLQLRIF